MIFKILFFFLIVYGTKSHGKPEAKDCFESPPNNWNCNMRANGNEVLWTNIKFVKNQKEITMQTLFTTQVLSSTSLEFSPGRGRPDEPWSTAGLVSVLGENWDEKESTKQFTNIYKKEDQKIAIDSHCKINPSWYTGSATFFARGHYAPNADYTSNDYKTATFHYFNVAPQWQKYNNGNWRQKVEAPIQSLIKKTSTTYQIFTGSYGQLKCPNNQNVKLFLTDSSAQPNFSVKIPIPVIYFRIIAPSPLRDQDTPIFIASSNHPTWTKPEIEQYLRTHFCDPNRDLCDKIPQKRNDLAWFSQSEFRCDKGTGTTFIEKGYTYACHANADILNKVGISLFEGSPKRRKFGSLSSITQSLERTRI